MNWLLVRWVVFSMSMVLVGSSSFCDQGAATVSPVRANSASGYPYPAYLFVLHEGRMIRTNRHAEAARLLNRIEMMGFKKELARYLRRHAAETRQPKPYRRVSPIIPTDEAQGSGRYRFSVSLLVNRDGLPEHLSLQGDLPPRNVHAIEDALRQWLFFPGLLEGQPVDTPVVFKYLVAGW